MGVVKQREQCTYTGDVICILSQKYGKLTNAIKIGYCLGKSTTQTRRKKDVFDDGGMAAAGNKISQLQYRRVCLKA